MSRLRIALAADHGGFELKERLKEHLKAAGHEVADLGTTQGRGYCWRGCCFTAC